MAEAGYGESVGTMTKRLGTQRSRSSQQRKDITLPKRTPAKLVGRIIEASRSSNSCRNDVTKSSKRRAPPPVNLGRCSAAFDTCPKPPAARCAPLIDATSAPLRVFANDQILMRNRSCRDNDARRRFKVASSRGATQPRRVAGCPMFPRRPRTTAGSAAVRSRKPYGLRDGAS